LTPSVRLEFRPSRSLAAVLGMLHLIALFALVISLSMPALALAVIGVCLSGLVLVNELLRRPYGGVFGLRLDHTEAAAPSVTWRDDQGRWQEATLEGDGFVSPWLVILNLTGQQGRIRVVLGPDSADADALRALRVWLRGRHSPDPGK